MAAKTDDGLEVIIAEVRSTKETADSMANGESPKGDADDLRVLAGMVHQVAEQVERLVQLIASGEPKASGHSPPDTAA
jgi:hypothetical protein